MKIRNGFVSNSSSSSFIVISEDNTLNDIPKFVDNVIGQIGEKEFGWQFEKYNDSYSKINFAYLQMRYMVKNKIKGCEKAKYMLTKVLKDVLKIDKIYSNIDIEYSSKNKEFAYIDHASSAVENANIEMFESQDTLKRFLFNSDSYIQNQNDNC